MSYALPETGIQMSVQPAQVTYQSQIVVSPTSVAGGVGELLSNSERTLQTWNHSLYRMGCMCCCKREIKRFEMEVTTERLTNVITEIQHGCCGDPQHTVSYESVYLPHVVGMAMGKSRLLKAPQPTSCIELFCPFLSMLKPDEEAKPCCCDPNTTPADWLHVYTTSDHLQVRAYLPVAVFPQIRVAIASAKAPMTQAMR